jgi:DNA-binding IclR family transcriptional regulator
MVSLQTLVDEIGARRADVRRTVSSLHREGYVDALRMRLTMTGFGLGLALLRIKLPRLRSAQLACAAA